MTTWPWVLTCIFSTGNYDCTCNFVKSTWINACSCPQGGKGVLCIKVQNTCNNTTIQMTYSLQLYSACPLGGWRTFLCTLALFLGICWESLGTMVWAQKWAECGSGWPLLRHSLLEHLLTTSVVQEQVHTCIGYRIWMVSWWNNIFPCR